MHLLVLVLLAAAALEASAAPVAAPAAPVLAAQGIYNAFAQLRATSPSVFPITGVSFDSATSTFGPRIRVSTDVIAIFPLH